MNTLISFVIPCYRSENTISKVVDEIINTVSTREGYDYEIIAVNDCSPDKVGSVLRKLAESNSRIKVINFAKNMGKHAAVLAGYAVTKGAYVVDLDDDCQSPVYELWKLLDPVANDECDYATAEYSTKKESAFKSFGSDVNLWMSRILLEKPKGLRFENFSVMKKFICDEVVNYKNPFPYIEGLVLRVTKNVKTVPMEQRERGDDNASGFTFKKSMKLLVNGLTAFSVKPLRFASIFGFLFAMFGFIWGTYTVINKLIDSDVLIGYSSLMAVLLLASGMIMMMLGMIGEYIGRIYICINDSPQYVIKNTINL
jgi:undecaprenyl-phosphate 4-deoxy-4-formamido-L-arabinose transferase